MKDEVQGRSEWLSIDARPLLTGRYLVGHKGWQEVMHYFGPERDWIQGTKLGFHRHEKQGWVWCDPRVAFNATHCMLIQVPDEVTPTPIADKAGTGGDVLTQEENYLLCHIDAECGIMRGDIEGAFHRIRAALSAPVGEPVALADSEKEAAARAMALADSRKLILETSDVSQLGHASDRDWREYIHMVDAIAPFFTHPPAPAVGAEDVARLLEEARDMLMERIYGNPARSPGHNARLKIEKAISLLFGQGGGK